MWNGAVDLPAVALEVAPRIGVSTSSVRAW
jgi:hypothetical protein